MVDNYHAIVSRRHRFAGLDVVTWQDLAEEKLVILDKSYGLNAIIRESFRQCGLRPNIAFECDQVDAILGMVEGNFGISILSKRIAATQYDVEAIPIDPPISRNTVLVVPKEVEARQRLAGGFVRHIVDYYRDNTPRPLRGAVASALRARAVPGILPSRTVRRTEREGEFLSGPASRQGLLPVVQWTKPQRRLSRDMETNILIVDDEAAIADLVEVYLKNEGYTVHKFGRAGDALACVASTPLDLAIPDVMLPDMDGFTLCQKIREAHLFPILMLTARVEDMDKIMGLTLGADDYLTKPFNPLELVARVKTQLRRYTRYNQGGQPGRGAGARLPGAPDLPGHPQVRAVRRGAPLTPWNFPSHGTCASTGGRWCPARSCSSRCGERSIWTATTPSCPTSPACGRRCTNPAESRNSSRLCGGGLHH